MNRNGTMLFSTHILGLETKTRTSPPNHQTYESRLGMAKCLAKLILTPSKGIIIPSHEEWIGLNALERDDELPERKPHTEPKS